MINIRSLNTVTLSNVYLISLQTNIIQIVNDCQFISVIDCAEFFYQWRVHFVDRHKLTVVSHREQKTFNVTIMRFKNSSFYVQRQIDRVLRSYKDYFRAYINDIVVFSKTKQNHMTHLRKIFSILTENNIIVNSLKAFIEFSFVTLLEQRMTSLKLSIEAEKMKVISSLSFSRIFDELNIYLEFTNWLKQYVSNYVARSESLQNRKTTLLKSASKVENAKKSYIFRTKLLQSTTNEIAAFKYIQHHFFNKRYFVHFDSIRQLYIDLNSSDKDIDAMIYHIKNEYNARLLQKSNLYSSR